MWIPILSTYVYTDRWLWNIVAHEFGHNLGLHHANTLGFGPIPLGPLDFDVNTVLIGVDEWPVEGDWASAPVSGTNTEYGDPFSVMGITAYSGPYSGEHRARNLGWIPPGATADGPAPGTYSLAPVEDSSGLRNLRVLRDAQSNSWLWVEFHQPSGYYERTSLDSIPGNDLADGAQVHYESTFADQIIGDSDSDLLHTYKPGSPISFRLTS